MAHNLTRPPFVDGTRFNQITLFDGARRKTQNTFDRARFNQITFLRYFVLATPPFLMERAKKQNIFGGAQFNQITFV